jgi:hypothetical protein
VIAITILFAIFQYLKRTAGPARWADSRRSYHLQQARNHLLSAGTEPQHPRDWRPHFLLFSNDTHRRRQLLEFASWLEGDAGLTTAVRILEGRGVKMIKQKEQAEEELRKDIAESGLDAFPLVISVPEFNQGLQTLVQAFGIGPMRANTILLNWIQQLPEGVSAFKEILYGRHLRTAYHFGCNLLVLAAKQEAWANLKTAPSAARRIDVWWRGDATSRLMLLLAYLMTRSDAWEEAGIRVLAVASEEQSEKTVEELKNTLNEVRIDAEPEIIQSANADIVSDHSPDAALVFLPFRLRGNQPVDLFGEPLNQIVSRLPVTALVMAAEDIDLDAEPEEGKAGDTAEAVDALADAEKRARDAEKDAAKAAEAVSAAKDELQKLRAETTDPDVDAGEIKALEASLEKAERNSEKAARRSAKAKVKLDAAAQAVEELGLITEKNEKDTSDSADIRSDSKR